MKQFAAGARQMKSFASGYICACVVAVLKDWLEPSLVGFSDVYLVIFNGCSVHYTS